MPTSRTCRRCGGQGSVDVSCPPSSCRMECETAICPSCHGTGWMVESSATPTGWHQDPPIRGRLVVSAPFGNYLDFAGCTSTLGTYTLRRRAGLLTRLWRVLSTVRYDRRTGSWVNRLGLPNPGIAQLPRVSLPGRILSVHGFDAGEWRELTDLAIAAGVEVLELNLSCPNVERSAAMVEEASGAIDLALDHGVCVVAKLSPVRPLEMGAALYDKGVRCFHLCNTLPVPGGGMSGKPLLPLASWAVSDFRQEFAESVFLIGGGGVTGVQDALTYLKAGADRVAIASMLLNPFNWRKVPQMVAAVEDW